MKTKMIASLGLVATTLLASTSAQAGGNDFPLWYVSLGAGAAFNDDGGITVNGVSGGSVATDSGYLFSAALGYAPDTKVTFFDHTRWELEYTYRENDLNSVGGVSTTGKVESHSFFGNLYVDFHNNSNWTPYVGGGLGITNVEADLNIDAIDDNVAAWQLMAGLGYAPSSLPNTVWSLGYRYHDTFEDAKFTSAALPAEYEYSGQHSVEANARFRF